VTAAAIKYVLITPARNEEAVIGKTLASVVAQTRAPERWVIVDDGSTDRTAAIVEEYARRYPWIVLVRRPLRVDRNFAGKVHAVNAGVDAVRGLQFEVLGNLDADVSFDADYMEFLLHKFAADPRLGIAGTPFTQPGGYDSTRDSFEGEHYVAGPCQLFRYTCFVDIGGYVPNPAGGVDWIAVMTARMKGWTVTAFDEKRFHHHRLLGTAERSDVAALFSYGEKDYYLGGSPFWQLIRGCYRMKDRPFVVGGLALLSGFTWAALKRTPRPVSRELMQFHRRDQMRKLRTVLGAVVRLKKPDAFRLATERRPD
jgi:glycosyltransferase involved in cell wall biosynthesis